MVSQKENVRDEYCGCKEETNGKNVHINAGSACHGQQEGCP